MEKITSVDEEIPSMKLILALAILTILTGCQPSAERSSPTESEKQMLQCKDNIRRISAGLGPNPTLFEKNEPPLPKKLDLGPLGPVTCPVAREDTYTKSYDPKTGNVFCQGEHHQKVSLAADYPRLVLSRKPLEEQEFRIYGGYAPHVVESETGVTSLPTGFPLPLDSGYEVLSTTVGRRDGTWYVFLRYDGDTKALEETWRDVLSSHVYYPGGGDSVGFSGDNVLANGVSVRIYHKQKKIQVSYEPAFLINDLAQ